MQLLELNEMMEHLYIGTLQIHMVWTSVDEDRW